VELSSTSPYTFTRAQGFYCILLYSWNVVIQLSRQFITNRPEKAIFVTDDLPWMFYSHFGGQETPFPWTAWKFVSLYTKSDCQIPTTSHQRTANSPSAEAFLLLCLSNFYYRVPVIQPLGTPQRDECTPHIHPYLYTCLISSSISTWVSETASFLQDFQTTASHKKNPVGNEPLVGCQLLLILLV